MHRAQKVRKFCFDVDGTTLEHDGPRITGGEIMDAAGIPRNVGLLFVSEDGSHEVVGDDEVVNLASLVGQFKHCKGIDDGPQES